MTSNQLRERYPVFEYKSSSWKVVENDLLMEWQMEAGDLKFSPKTTIHGSGQKANLLEPNDLDNLVFNLGMADIFSYWKATCSPKIKVTAGSLNEEQINFWQTLLIKGMGQYFFENKIDFRAKDFVTIEIARHSGEPKATPESPLVLHKSDSGQFRITEDGSILIPVGGGKDSAVTLEILTKNFSDQKVGAFAMNLARSDKIQPSAQRLMNEAKIKNQIFVQRIIDPKLFDLKSQGYLNGHVPFSGYLAFLSILIARLFGYSNIAFSNERSSNESNLEYLGEKINHQYSKTTEFENMFRHYNSKYLSSINYFSFLRPLFELQIMKIFSKMTTYFEIFRSCNQGYLTDSWCAKCPKCLAVFVGLFPFAQEKELLKIFGKNMFEDESLLELAKNVLGAGNGKPFECVGTFEETIAAFDLSVQKYGDQKLPVLLNFFQKEILPKHANIEQLKKTILTAWDTENNLPEQLRVVLKKSYAAN